MGSKYTVGRPTQEVRLRNWPAGQAAQLKHAISLLETELNKAIASQTDQGTARKLSPRVPKVTGLSVRAGFKNFQITFNEAKGINNLLFYEIQKSSVANFATSRSYHIPQTTLTIPTETENETIYVRVRCVNTKFEVGPWSDSETQIGSSNFRINVTKTPPFSIFLDKTSNEWTGIATITYNPIFGSVCLNCHVGVMAYDARNFSVDNPTGDEPNTVILQEQDIAVEFRFTKDGVEIPGRFTCSVNALNAIGDGSGRTEMILYSSMVSPFDSFTGIENPIEFKLEARIAADSNSRKQYIDASIDTFTEPLYDPLLKVDMFELLEIIQVSL